MQQQTPAPGYSSIVGVDPYIDWALGAGSTFFLVAFEGRQWLPVLLQLSDGINARGFAEGEWAAEIRIPSLYTTESPVGLEDAVHCTALVTEAFFSLLRDNKKLSKQVARVALGPPLYAERPGFPAAIASSGQG